jgi:hypothetical protein
MHAHFLLLERETGLLKSKCIINVIILQTKCANATYEKCDDMISHYSTANRSKILKNMSNMSGDSTSNSGFGKNLLSLC